MIGEILQPTHLIFILIVALLFLGPKRLPAAGRALGQSLKEFKGSLTGEPTDGETPAASHPSDTSPANHNDRPTPSDAKPSVTSKRARPSTENKGVTP
jgi:sec-independent protein translocase protein TatA